MTDIDTAALTIANLARAADKPSNLEPGCIYAFMTDAGPKVVDLFTDEKYLDAPRRKHGTVTVDDVASFAQYWDKHAYGADAAPNGSEVFADVKTATITAVLNAHQAHEPDWQDHRLTLQLEYTPEWSAWAKNNTRSMSQAAFAEFIEDHLTDIASDDKAPCSPADLLEMAQQFQAHTKVEFKSGHRISSGQVQFAYAETIEAKAGERGTITIPTAFDLGIRVFDDLEPYRVKARFRYRMHDGALTLSYHLNDPERVTREAVGLVVAKAEAACGVKIMLGRPS